tara:strand:+ start:20 stop:451 length:432 start_codon:yes stop_codon:yes gene_type:complete
MKVIKILLLLFLIPTVVIAGPETCYNGMQNFGELGIDCGGPCDLECPTCEDGVKNQGETGVDCGSPCESCNKTKLSLVMFSSTLAAILVVLTFLYLARKRIEKDLQEYIITLRKKGYDPIKIKESLKVEGWSDKEIEKAHKER